MMRTPRKYEPIWNKLKAHGYCKIAAPVQDHYSIWRMVQKEKIQDLAHKAEVEIAGKTSKLRHSSKGTILEIWLDVTTSLLHL